MGRRGGGADDPSQLRINWGGVATSNEPVITKPAASASDILPTERSDVASLVQRLPWDFKTSFPQPTEEAIDAGVFQGEELSRDGITYVHEEQARQMLATLNELDAVLDAKRRGVDPGNGKVPMLAEAKTRLQKFFETEPQRLEQWYENLLGAYADGFGTEAANALDKAIRAWHAGIEVVAEAAKNLHKANNTSWKVRVSSCLPVPKPLHSSVKAGVFGQDESGKPIRPTVDEVRAITEQYAERMIEMDDDQLRSATVKYAEDFGSNAALQLERYVQRQKELSR